MAHPDGDGASFFPDKPFLAGEQVIVKPGVPVAGDRDGTVTFTVLGAARTVPPFGQPASPSRRPGDVQRFVSRPDLAPPGIHVVTRTAAASANDIFLAPKLGDSQQGPMILDARGRLVWFKALPKGQQAYDFRVQRYRGKPVLTWWQGDIHGYHGIGYGVVMDSSYRPLATVRAGNGYNADLHEFQLTPQGTALVTSYHPVPRDLRFVGGAKDGVVMDCIVQEVDVATGLVLFEWHALGHVGLKESYLPVHNPLGSVYDYFHLNSIDLEPDGDLLISSRHTHTLYEIDRATGRILWRMGGKRSDFRMGKGTDFAWQHDAKRQPDGTISLFDNSANNKPGPRSSGKVLSVDMAHHAVHLVRELGHPRPLTAPTQGSMQPLPGGGAFVGWGGTNRDFTEYDAQGNVVFDAYFTAPQDESYRAYRFDWTGTPVVPPRVALSGGKAYASWNGATQVASWRLLTGAAPGALAPGPTVTSAGFETALPVAGRPAYVAVQALDASGAVLGTAKPVKG
ncbi:MAG TPA: arylsulfotransferase family protein [Solirubrobacteraceae bacterium]|nr:arylsulfotransferase family protein [Solirubrobacteraceae bacterium]